MCRVLGVSESGFHAWRTRTPSARTQQDTAIRVAIRAAHARSDGTYGSPRILEDLRDVGYRVGRKRIARMMRVEGLCGVSKRRGPARPGRMRISAMSITRFGPKRSPVSVDADHRVSGRHGIS